MDKQMNLLEVIIYKFSSRGLWWPAIFGAAFATVVLPFSNFINCLIGVIIGYILILPGIGIFSPITFAILLGIASYVGIHSDDPFWGKVALALLLIHLFRAVASLVLVRKYPAHTLMLDSQYQQKR